MDVEAAANRVAALSLAAKEDLVAANVAALNLVANLLADVVGAAHLTTIVAMTMAMTTMIRIEDSLVVLREEATKL